MAIITEKKQVFIMGEKYSIAQNGGIWGTPIPVAHHAFAADAKSMRG
ncbi:MAG: hypothetical protein JRI27_10925 [Deltaproteobacteria bacterium]|nr:hypothetical protein [Deltaproteobacteria bacterium]